MRINKFVALATGMSRRAADRAIMDGQILVNNGQPDIGYDVRSGDLVTYEGHRLEVAETATIIMNKPTGYVVSREGQGNKTVYELLPDELHNLKPVGRLDKESSGLLLMTNDGELANRLTHPSFEKQKVYEVSLLKPLRQADVRALTTTGVQLEDGPSRLDLKPLDTTGRKWQVTMAEGRNRQIRRTFAALGYTVDTLHRIAFGPYTLNDLDIAKFKKI